MPLFNQPFALIIILQILGLVVLRLGNEFAKFPFKLPLLELASAMLLIIGGMLVSLSFGLGLLPLDFTKAEAVRLAFWTANLGIGYFMVKHFYLGAYSWYASRAEF